MSIIPPISASFYFMTIICIGSSFQVSQIQFKFLFEAKISCWWILDKLEDSHFLTCSQKCWRNSECFGIALGHLKENRADNRIDCYLLKKLDVSEQHCTVGDYDEEEVEFYEKIEPASITSTTTDVPTKTAEVTTTEKPSTSAETTSLFDDTTTTTEMGSPVCDGNLVTFECSNPERSVIVAMTTSSDYLFSGGDMSIHCEEPFVRDIPILSSETILNPFEISEDIFFFCDSEELFTGFEICYSDEELKYSNYKCKKLLDGFFKGDFGARITNEDHPSEIRCYKGSFMNFYRVYRKGDETVSQTACTELKSRDENM